MRLPETDPLPWRGNMKLRFLTHAAVAQAINSALRFSRGVSCQKASRRRSARVWFENRIEAFMIGRKFIKF